MAFTAPLPLPTLAGSGLPAVRPRSCNGLLVARPLPACAGGSGPPRGRGRGGGGRRRADGGSGGGSGGRGSGPDGDSPGNDAELDSLLSQFTRTKDSVPADVLDAWASGRAGISVVKQVLVLEAIPILGSILRRWPALRNRLVANAKFPMILAVELAIGSFTKTLAETKTRGSNFWKEFDFYLSDMILEIIGDFSLVWMLSPAYQMAAAPAAGTVAGLINGLPSHVLQVGSFSPAQRIGAFGYKAVLFGLVGFAASMIGHSATVALVKRRQASQTATQPAGQDSEAVVLAPVWQNSVEWGKFMMVSSNFRYQLVGAVEQRVYETMLGNNIVLATVATFLTRLGNNYSGAVHWLRWAKATNLQG